MTRSQRESFAIFGSDGVTKFDSREGSMPVGTIPGVALYRITGQCVPAPRPAPFCGETGQYESAEITSPWSREPKAQTTLVLVVFLMNLTEPSAMATLQPPGWKLERPYIPAQSQSPSQLQVRQFGKREFGASKVFPKL